VYFLLQNDESMIIFIQRCN